MAFLRFFLNIPNISLESRRTSVYDALFQYVSKNLHCSRTTYDDQCNIITLFKHSKYDILQFIDRYRRYSMFV